jgi:hypothetical protein|tara:strand:+ start:3425 stop:3592 length:168 start_codon:yes stop_codon:yes gene_type:complete
MRSGLGGMKVLLNLMRTAAQHEYAETHVISVSMGLLKKAVTCRLLGVTPLSVRES